MIVVDISTARGLPVVPAAELIKQEGESGWFSVHFTPVNEHWVMLYHFEAETFLAIPNLPALLSRLPSGVVWSDFRQTAAIRRWRYWRVNGTDGDGVVAERLVRADADVPAADATESEPWVIGDVTVTKAYPTLSSVCAQPPDFVHDEIEERSR